MMDMLSVIFMLPFLVIEYNTICSYGLRWLQSWNLIDSIAYILQVLNHYCFYFEHVLFAVYYILLSSR